MMRAAILETYGQPLVIRDIAVPRPGPGEILIRLSASGVCHSDVHVWQGTSVAAVPPDPYILGHEGVGEVAELGLGVDDWVIGEPAGASWFHDTCGTCDVCRSGHESFCANQRAHGYHVPGTFAEYVVVPAAFAVKLPKGNSALMAPLMCAGLTAYGALDRAELKHGETCAIFGCGGLGLYAVQLAKRRGARVVAIDNDPAKLVIAEKLGASSTEQSRPGLAENWDETNRAEVTINFAPTAKTWATMLAATKPMGRIVAAAMVSEPVPLVQEWLTWTGVSISGTSVGTRAQMRALMALQEQSPLHSEIERIGLDDVTDALDALHHGRAKGRFCIVF